MRTLRPPVWCGLAGLCLLLCTTCSVVTSASNTVTPVAKHPTSSSIQVEFPMAESNRANDVLAYEISVRSLMNPFWTVVNPNLGAAGNNIFDSQIVSVRLDTGATMSGGSFELGLQYGGLLAEDFQQLARTTPIPWNASAAQFKAALDAIKSVPVREVRRCDQFGGNSDPGYGGSLGWSHGCPYGSQGGYRWLVVFDAPATDQVPTLFPYRNHLKGTYTGPGLQISVTRIREGMINPSFCGSLTCRYNVTGLTEDTPYSFRVRSLLDSIGWSDFSRTSYFVSTIAHKVPSRPTPPTPASAQATSLIFDVQYPAVNERVRSIGYEFRVYDFTQPQNWIWLENEISVGTSVGAPIQLKLSFLQPNTTYEARIRLNNDVGYSMFSSPSAPFTTLPFDIDLTAPSPPQILSIPSGKNAELYSIGSDYIDIVVQSNADLAHASSEVSYRVQYKPASQLNWISLPEVLTFSQLRTGVRRFEISTRITTVNKTAACEGYFWLQFNVVGSNQLISKTPPISMSASADQVAAALGAVGALKARNPSISVRRQANTLNGYTWTVEMTNSPSNAVASLNLLRHSMSMTVSYIVLDPVSNATLSVNTQQSACWANDPFRPVVVRDLSSGQDTAVETSKQMRINGLLPQTSYELRVQSLDLFGNILSVSASTHASTVADYLLDPTFLNTTTYNFNSFLNAWTAFPIPSLSMIAEAKDPSSARQQSVTIAGYLYSPARQNDVYYLPGVGLGGESGQDGTTGYCVFVLYNNRKLDGYRAVTFLYTGSEQFFTVPPPTPTDGTITYVTIKCWGAGGGGGKLTDLRAADEDTNSSKLHLERFYSFGGGGAFAQLSVHVEPGDTLRVVGGGGQASQGELGGKGGFGGGASGGNAVTRGLGAGGGGGGGASSVSRTNKVRTGAEDEILLVAAGGAGGGSTDYCCAVGGSGGDILRGGLAGSFPGANTPWPISDPSNPTRDTPVRRRYEYTSSACPDSSAGEYCISMWDSLPQSLPAEHMHLQYGEDPVANFSVWATAGTGGNSIVPSGGSPGVSGSVEFRTVGDGTVLPFGTVAVFTVSQLKGMRTQALYGGPLKGGAGADGKEGGGGGGGGYYGGGGGGSGNWDQLDCHYSRP
jgi:hypothetical protein